MRICLVGPRLNFFCTTPRLDAFLKQRFVSTMRDISLPLITVAGLVSPDDEVEYIDENYTPIDFDRRADLVGIHAMTPQAVRVFEIAAEFRRRGVPVVIGGPHATLQTHEVAQHADAVVVGEAENTWAQCIEDARRGELRATYRGTMADLGRASTPRYDLVESMRSSAGLYDFVPVQFSRGCPRNCAYCSVSLLCGKAIRSKTPSQIVREIEAILSSRRTDKQLIVKVIDANPFVDLKEARERIHAIGSTGVKWLSQSDVSLADNPKILRLLERSGCVMLSIGFESLDPTILAYASPWKRRRLHSYADALRIMRDYNVVLTGNFMLGFKPHTKEMLSRVRDFVFEYEILTQFYITTPYPGTRFYDDLVREHRLFPGLAWQYYNGFNLVYDMGMPAATVANDLAWLYEQTWSPELLIRIKRSLERIWHPTPDSKDIEAPQHRRQTRKRSSSQRFR